MKQRKPIFREGPKSVLDFERLIEKEGEGIQFHREWAGKGFYHVLSPDEIRERLEMLPKHLLRNLKTVVLPRMTKKRKRLDIYGLQWCSTIYLYPMPVDLPPISACRAFRSTFVKYGADYYEEDCTSYVKWAQESIKLFYREHILLHELGHCVDQKNWNARDREAFADAFAAKWERLK